MARLRDPHNLDHVDTYDIPYVKEGRIEPLGSCGRKKIDKFKCRGCVVVGNYYSLRGQHERAIVSFQRALRVNKNFHLWTQGMSMWS